MFYPFSAIADPRPQVTTPQAGIALAASTPTLLSWTAPNDGVNHRVSFWASTSSVSAVAGDIGFNFTTPDGVTGGPFRCITGGQNGLNYAFSVQLIIKPGSTFSIVQMNALTGGSCTFWGEIWGS